MFLGRLIWLTYLVPYTLILYNAFDTVTVISEGAIGIIGFSLTTLVVVIGYLFSFNLTSRINSKFLKLILVIAFIDELIDYIINIELDQFGLMIYLTILPSFIILWHAAFETQDNNSRNEVSPRREK